MAQPLLVNRDQRILTLTVPATTPTAKPKRGQPKPHDQASDALCADIITLGLSDTTQPSEIQVRRRTWLQA